MTTILTAIAMTIAIPAAAHAQTALPADPKPAPKAPSGHDMPGMSCRDMQGMMTGGHAGHRMPGGGAHKSKMAACRDAADRTAKPAVADPHAKHLR